MKRPTLCLVSLAICAPALAQQGGFEPRLLSAFHGLDQSRQIQIRALAACRSRTGRDGMPVVFSSEVDASTLDPSDFQVLRQSGAIGTLRCVTLRPADEPGELRTALLVGEYSSTDDPVASVEIVGEILSLDGGQNFLGATAQTIPLAAGPTLILAQNVPPADWPQGEGECPAGRTKSLVRAVWVGGITKPGGDEIDANEVKRYRVQIRQPGGALQTVTPFAIGDLGDGDNYHELCLDVDGTPESVSFPAGFVTDPNEDLNPDTEIAVTPVGAG